MEAGMNGLFMLSVSFATQGKVSKANHTPCTWVDGKWFWVVNNSSYECKVVLLAEQGQIPIQNEVNSGAPSLMVMLHCGKPVYLI